MHLSNIVFPRAGFVLVKDFTVDSGNVMEPKSSFEASENSFKDGTLFADSLDHEKHSNEGDYEIESDSVCESENASVRSPPISPTRSDQNNPNQDIFSPSFDRYECMIFSLIQLIIESAVLYWSYTVLKF